MMHLCICLVLWIASESLNVLCPEAGVNNPKSASEFGVSPEYPPLFLRNNCPHVDFVLHA